MSKTNPETAIKNQLLIDLWAKTQGFYWNHPTGTGVPLESVKRGLDYPKIKYGCPGSPDIIGIIPVTVTADMVGSTFGLAIGVEVKTATGRQSDQQRIFQREWESRGGKYILARSFTDVLAGIANSGTIGGAE